MGLLEAEGTAADEDEDAQADQDDREQHVLPALKDFCDGRAGGHELCQQDKCTVYEESVGHIRIYAALMFNKNDRLVLPKERKVILLLVNKHVI